MLLNGLPVRGERRRSLLLRLLAPRLMGRSEVDRLTLMDDLDPGRPEALALGALRQTVATLRADLGPQLVVTTTGDTHSVPFRATPKRFWPGPNGRSGANRFRSMPMNRCTGRCGKQS